MVIRNTVDWILKAAFRSQSFGWQDLSKSLVNSIGLLFVSPFIYRHLFQTLATRSPRV